MSAPRCKTMTIRVEDVAGDGRGPFVASFLPRGRRKLAVVRSGSTPQAAVAELVDVGWAEVRWNRTNPRSQP